MSEFETAVMDDPYGGQSEAVQLMPGEEGADDPFIFSGITTPGQEYTFSCWIRAESHGSIVTIGDSGVDFASLEVPSAWKRWVVTFVANETDLHLMFNEAELYYYIYHPKLELGSKATDWTPAPEDTEDSIEDVNVKVASAKTELEMLADCIKSLVTNSDGASLMTQTSTGWTFSTGDIENQVNKASELLDELTNKLGSTDAALEALSGSVDEFGVIAEYVHIGTYTYKDDEGITREEPSIDLGETDSEFKLKITNTAIMFTHGTTPLVTINSKNKSLTTAKATIESELQIGGNSRADGVWVWIQRANGNLGLTWKGVTS